MIDPARYPRLASYLERLPDGLRSFPECRARSSLAVQLLETLPDGAADLARDPDVRLLLTPGASLWMPEAHLSATVLAVADHYRQTDEEHVAWMLERKRVLYGSLMYRSVMAFSSPRMLLERAVARWSSIHQGTTLAVTTDRLVGQATVALSFPAGLFPPLVLQGLAAAFQAAMERSAAKRARVVLAEHGSGWARYRTSRAADVTEGRSAASSSGGGGASS